MKQERNTACGCPAGHKTLGGAILKESYGTEAETRNRLVLQAKGAIPQSKAEIPHQEIQGQQIRARAEL